MTIIAIDPGSVSGAYAIIHNDGTIAVGDLPGVNRQVDAAALARMVQRGVHQAFVENVGPMPNQGISTTFKFAVSVGIIRGVLAGAGIPVTYLTPQAWKSHFKLRGKDKEAARALAILRHPTIEGLERKKDHGRAEALLMLDYAMETMQ